MLDHIKQLSEFNAIVAISINRFGTAREGLNTEPASMINLRMDGIWPVTTLERRFMKQTNFDKTCEEYE